MPCNLMLHAGAAAVPRPALARVETPAPTPTWQPIPHEDFVAQVEDLLPRYDLRVVNQAHALTHDHARYFGLLEVRNGSNHPDYTWVLGLRNSHDKSIPAGLVAGSAVYVCDNLAFSGEVKVSRKHTSFLLRDLPMLLGGAVEQLVSRWKVMDRRVEAYKGCSLANYEVNDLAIRALDAGVLSASRIPDLLHEYREPKHEEFAPRSLWSFFNAGTEVLKGALHMLPRRSQTLHQICDQFVGLS